MIQTRVAAGISTIVVAVLCSTSCSGSPAAPKTDSLVVNTATPARDTVLRAGTEMTFSYDITFTLTSESAIVGMIFLPVVDGGSLEGGSSPLQTIRKGTSRLTLTHTLTIHPRATRMDVFIAMENQDRIGQTSTVISYPVQ